MELLASLLDADDYGLSGVTESSLARASARIRGHLRQQVTRGTSTIVLPESSRCLPERPVVAVSSVVDENGVTLPVNGWELVGDRILAATPGRLTVTYQHGFQPLPDDLIELTCSIALRLASIPTALVAGTQQEGTGPWQHTYGFDSHKATSGLTAGEKEVLARYWPAVPRTISLGSPAG